MAHSQADKEMFISIFRSNATDVSRSCKAFGINRKTFYDWYNAEEAFREAVEEARQEVKDFGESQLLTLMKGIPKLNRAGKIVGWIARPDTAAIIFFNKTKNKDRGYIERVEIRNREEPTIDMAKLSAEERNQLYDLLAKADEDSSVTG
jgi:hypothetical protein